jgi:DNA invertase Pin-like site-specific DNA recombinase
MTAKTTNERQRALVERRREAGLKQIRNLWCHPDDEPAIREHAAKLARKRAKQVRPVR